MGETEHDDGRDVPDRLAEARRQLHLHAEEAGDTEAHDLAERVERMQAGEDPLPEETAHSEARTATDGGLDGSWIRGVQQRSHEWRMETIGDGVTPLSQAGHASVEANEVLDLFVKGETYDDSWVDENERELMLEIGDFFVAGLGVPSLLGLDVVDCIEAALEKNGAREWEGWQTQVADWDEEMPADD